MSTTTTTQLPSSKVVQYEEFVDKTLKVQLNEVLERRDKMYEEISEYMKLQTQIEMLQSAKLSSMKSMVDLGFQFYMQANVPDTSRVFVDVGFGFHVEFTHDEAIAFIEKKTVHIQRRADVLTSEAAQIKAHIKVVLHALHEIQFGISKERN